MRVFKGRSLPVNGPKTLARSGRPGTHCKHNSVKIMRRRLSAVFLTAFGLAACSALAAVPSLTGSDVGVPSYPGSLTTAPDGSGGTVYTVTGGGADIWGTADNFYYAYFKATGDFDYVVNVKSHVGNSGDGGWSKAELMARLDDGSGVPQAGDPFIANMATRPSSDTANGAPAGTNARGPQWRANRDGNASWTTPNPAFPPKASDNWLRLERIGSVFYMYTSDDGQAWSMFNPFNPQGWDTAGSWPEGADNPAESVFKTAWPNTILLGLAVTSHNDADISTVTFTDFKPYTPTPVAITTQPAAAVSVAQNTPLELSVAATGDPVHYEWRKNGTAIPKAIGPTYKVDLAQPSDAGTYTVRVFGGGKEVITSESAVTVTVDTLAPSVVGVTPLVTFTELDVKFSEPVTDTALTAANFAIDQGITVSSITRNSPDSVRLKTSKLAEGASYTLTINGVKDTANPANTIAADTKVPFKSLVFAPGVAIYQRWDNANGDPGDLAAFATAYTAGTLREPDVAATVTQFGGPWGVADNYSSCVRGYFVAPSSGDYVFFLSADDQARLYLSTDENPANKKLIAQESSWSNQYQWHTPGSGAYEDKRSDYFITSEWATPNVITLQAQKRYYLEILQDEGGGGDGSDATFIKSGEEDPTQDAAGMLLKGNAIGAYLDPNGASIDIAQPPASVSAAENTAATFTVSATGTSAYGTTVTYQWQKAAKGSATFADIAGATGSSYTTPLLTFADDGTQYRVVCRVPTLTVTSDAAIVTLTNDAIPPTVVSAGALKGTPRVGVAFSELMDKTSAETASNYTVAGATVTSAVLHLGTVVELNLAAAINSAPAVTVKNVKDLAGNTLASASVTGELSDMTSADVGDPGVDPLQPGYGFAAGNGGYLVAGGGRDIWDNADGFHFVYKEFTGPFDMRARIVAMNPMGLSTWAKAELMVRETTAGGSRHNSVCVTRTDGENAVEAQWRDTTDGASGNLRFFTQVPYPNAWIRLVREDATSGEIKAYTSTDGVNWTLNNTHVTPATDPDPALPATVLVGMAVTSHDNSGNDVLAEGLYDSFSVVPYTPVVDPQLKVARQAGQITITWATGTLVSSPTVNGTFTPVANATSPYAVAPTGATMFYQIRQ